MPHDHSECMTDEQIADNLEILFEGNLVKEEARKLSFLFYHIRNLEQLRVDLVDIGNTFLWTADVKKNDAWEKFPDRSKKE